MNEGKERGVQFVIFGDNSSKTLELLEEALDQMALFVQISVHWPGIRKIALEGDRVTSSMT